MAVPVYLEFIKQGKPTQNTFIERFNRAVSNQLKNMHDGNPGCEYTNNWSMMYCDLSISTGQ